MNKLKIILYIVSDIIITIFSIARSLFTHRLVYQNDIQLNKPASILGSGPSLKEELMNNSFSSSDVWVVNDFAISEYYSKIKPKYYIFADPDYWIESSEPNNQREEVFNQITMNTDWDMVILFPNKALRNCSLLNIAKNNLKIKILGFNTFIFKLHNTSITNFNLKYNLTAPTQNVIAAAIYIAINLGYKRIEIFGADHSWTEDLRVNNKNQVCLIDRHFYDSENQIYYLKPWKKAAANDFFSMYEILKTLSNIFLQYEYLQRYAIENDVTVNNCTPNSFIDSFQKKI
jgi:hypothetical protein